MAATFDRELLEILRECEVWPTPHILQPITRINFPVPTGIKSRHTANEVLKQAGIPKRF